MKINEYINKTKIAIVASYILKQKRRFVWVAVSYAAKKAV